MMGGGGFALQSLLTIKKSPIPLNVQSNEGFLKFLQQLLLYMKWHDLQRKKLHCPNIVLYLGGAIALPMIAS